MSQGPKPRSTAVRDTDRSGRSERTELPEDDDHLAGVPDGCGCTEVWEHLSDHRA